MSKTTTLPVTQNVKNAFYAVASTLGALSGESGNSVSNLVALYTAGSNDAVVKSLTLASSDTAAKIINFYVNNGSFDYLLFSIPVPANSGNNSTTTNVDVLGSSVVQGLPLDSSGRPVLPLAAGYVLKLGIVASTTSGKTITASAIVEEY